MNPINQKIRELRKSKNLSQEALGAKLGISGQAVAKWEKGDSYPDICNIPLLCEIFNVSADELLGVSLKDKYSHQHTLKTLTNEYSFSMNLKEFTPLISSIPYHDICHFLQFFTDEVTFRVLQTILTHSTFSENEISEISGLCLYDVRKAISILNDLCIIKEDSLFINSNMVYMILAAFSDFAIMEP